MKDIEVLDAVSPKSKSVLLSIGSVEVKPMGVKNLIRLIALMKDAQISAPAGAGDEAAAMAVLMGAGERLPEVISLLVGEASSAKFDELTIEDLSVLVLAAVEVNRVQTIRENFLAATRAITAG